MVNSTRPRGFAAVEKPISSGPGCVAGLSGWSIPGGRPCPTECEEGSGWRSLSVPWRRNEPGERCLRELGGGSALLINASAPLPSPFPPASPGASSRRRDISALEKAQQTAGFPWLSRSHLPWPAALRALRARRGSGDAALPDPAGAGAGQGRPEAWRGQRVHPRPPGLPSAGHLPAGPRGARGLPHRISWEPRTTKPRRVLPPVPRVTPVTWGTKRRCRDGGGSERRHRWMQHV